MTWWWGTDALDQQTRHRDGAGFADPYVPAEMVLSDRRNAVIGRLRFRICLECRTGRILDVWILDAWQRQGLGAELVRCLLTCRPGLQWSTTLQTRQGRAFFAAMAEETSVCFPHGKPLCVHLTGRIARGWRRTVDRLHAAFPGGFIR